MAFVPYSPGDAGYTGQLVNFVSGYSIPIAPGPYADSAVVGLNAGDVFDGTLSVTKSPLYNPQGLVVDGWQTLQTGEDPDPGGSNRPTSGMIYPRGTG